ncbi:hypothetical protein [Pseudarthrobacter sp. fls2-241-R2A-168]|uniref:hypothetical protein n=1 Tax=Pseudarthrobacter sp. fls2-241-R2A-168 TaxID=3040304 RepID=UPI002556FB4A|nr:hypothetical protein [Pseudarthrobacter sp. fls2-241-R2A-168]
MDMKKDSDMDNDRPPAIPLIRFEPQLIRQWQHLWRNELVELRSNGKVLGRGHIDITAEDASTIWIYRESGGGRIMIHAQDGIDIWRVDPDGAN